MPRSSKPAGETPAGDEPPIQRPPVRRRRSRRQAPTVFEYPVVAIRDQVYFPGMSFRLLIGRDRSVAAVEMAMDMDLPICLVAQRDPATEDPEPEDLYDVGVLAHVVHILRVPDGTISVSIEAEDRLSIRFYSQTSPYLMAGVEMIETFSSDTLKTEALMRSVFQQFEHIVNVGRQIPPEALANAAAATDPGRLADVIIPYLQPVRVDVKQDLLETAIAHTRLEKLSEVLEREREIIDVQQTIRGRVEREMNDSQREMILREQLKAIQSELGDLDDRAGEIDEYHAKIEAAGMPDAVLERATKELGRLERMPSAAPEGLIIRNYLDWLVALPWSTSTDEQLDVEGASGVLEEDHYGLAKVKERILEFLAVRQLAGATMKGPILCFVGPPGVGKTSLGRSIARALGRKFIRLSLGGVRDEAEIRGHRRTYVGALPGRIIQSVKHVGSRNPVFMLDEIDKLGIDFRGDPSSALLEALDPEQNSEFSDHYLEVPFDLRDVMFITTANLLDPIPAPLRDRMEVIEFAGYTEEEKLNIARQFLVPKQRTENGITEKSIEVPDETLQAIIRDHTREAGVRGLERQIASICRKIARKVAGGDTSLHVIKPEDLSVYLGQARFHYGIMGDRDEVGAATGLVYTEFGGDIVTIEVTPIRNGEGKLLLTGQLGDVMKESAQAALTCVRSRAESLGIDPDFHRTADLHIHVPAGAVPKDGPSAGITIATALASALTGRAVRRDLAMTGEITLRGKVLPIGGLKEKVLAAHRAGIRRVIVPEENRPDLDDVPEIVRADMTFELVEAIGRVLELALV